MLLAERDGVSICTTGIYGRTLYPQYLVSLRIVSFLSGSQRFFFIAMQVQYSYTFVQQNPIYAVLYVRTKSLAERECVSTCTTEMNSKTLSAQHPVVPKELRIIASFSPTVYFGMPSSALLQLCTAEHSMRRTLYSKIFSSRT